jgi:heat shock protein HtpX
MRGNNDQGGVGIGYFVVSIIAEIVLGFLASIIVMWFSRYREFRADAGGAKLAGREQMIAALRALQRVHEPQDLPAGEFAAFGISGNIGDGLKKLFASHPPLEERIAALEAARV